MNVESTELARDIGGVAALNEPVRRALYLHVAQQDRAVSRDAAAQAVLIPYGFESRRGSGMALRLRNCPFHVLTPQPNSCCVAFRDINPAG